MASAAGRRRQQVVDYIVRTYAAGFPQDAELLEKRAVVEAVGSKKRALESHLATLVSQGRVRRAALQGAPAYLPDGPLTREFESTFRAYAMTPGATDGTSLARALGDELRGARGQGRDGRVRLFMALLASSLTSPHLSGEGRGYVRDFVKAHLAREPGSRPLEQREPLRSFEFSAMLHSVGIRSVAQQEPPAFLTLSPWNARSYDLPRLEPQNASLRNLLHRVWDAEGRAGRQGDWTEVESECLAALARLPARKPTAGLAAGKAELLYRLGSAYLNKAAWRMAGDALEKATQAVDRAPQGVKMSLLARAHNQLGLVCTRDRRFRNASHWLKRSLREHESLGDGRGIAIARTNLGVLADEQGQFGDAAEWHRKSLQAKLDRGDVPGCAASLTNWGVTLLRSGRVEEALSLFERSLAVACISGNVRNLAHACLNLAEAHVMLRQEALAMEFSDVAAELARDDQRLRIRSTIVSCEVLSLRNEDLTRYVSLLRHIRDGWGPGYPRESGWASGLLWLHNLRHNASSLSAREMEFMFDLGRFHPAPTLLDEHELVKLRFFVAYWLARHRRSRQAVEHRRRAQAALNQHRFARSSMQPYV